MNIKSTSLKHRKTKLKLKQLMSLVILFIFTASFLIGCGKVADTNNSISLNKTSCEITIGQSFTLTLTTENTSEVEWTTTDQTVLNLTPNDLSCEVMAVKVGAAKVIATQSGVEVKCDVIVKKAVPIENKLSLNLTEKEVDKGKSFNLVATFQNFTEEITWTAQDNATVILEPENSSCAVYGLASGETTITATTKNSTSSCLVTVQEAELNIGDINSHSVTLTYYDSDASSYGITWHSNHKYIYPVVQFNDENNLETTKIFKASEQVFDNAKTYQNTFYTDYIYKAVIKNLTPNTKYNYTIGDFIADIWLDEASLKTKSAQIDSFTFINITDSQETGTNYDDLSATTDSGEYSYNALKGAFEVYPEAELIVHCGDMVEWSEYEDSWFKMLNKNKEYYMSIPTIMVTGNHEAAFRGSDYATYRHYNNRLPNSQSTKLGTYYSLDYGNAHFTVINTNDLLSNRLKLEQLEWLKSDLANTDKRWKFVLLHNPLYSPAKWGSDPSRNQIALSLRAHSF